MRLGLAAAAAFALAAALAWFALRPPPAPPAPRPDPGPAQFAGSASCASCHAEQHARWQDSQHALAMQHATDKSVLGDFGNARLRYAGTESTFYRRDGKFLMRTDGADGKLAEFEIKYAFGVYPLQQYLVEFPDGRLQAPSLAWDLRPRSAGGQRWFHLYPREKIDFRDELHWTKRSQNWNFMCADCHSTTVRKGYDAASDSFKTTWSEISVGCEACHGPGSRHLSNPKEKLATPGMDACAQCHARRSQIAEGFHGGKRFLDHYRPALLEPGLYHPDGQQRDEVYVWGSFLQSRMHRMGVTCGDCHEPHGAKLRAEGNAVCAKCHVPAKYDAPAHHFHQAGARCVDCHMPTENYMVVDPRRDHSFRVPRPDLSVSLGVPNACSACHADKGAKWAAAALVKRYGHRPEGFQRFAATLAEGASIDLAALAADVSQPEIARASALAALERQPYASPGTGLWKRAVLVSSDWRSSVFCGADQSRDSIPSGEGGESAAGEAHAAGEVGSVRVRRCVRGDSGQSGDASPAANVGGHSTHRVRGAPGLSAEPGLNARLPGRRRFQ
jgi:hypothetical protein